MTWHRISRDCVVCIIIIILTARTTLGSSTVNFMESSTAVLPCTDSLSSPALVYWYKSTHSEYYQNGPPAIASLLNSVVDADPGLDISSDLSLRIKFVTLSHAGIYRCTVQQSLSSDPVDFDVELHVSERDIQETNTVDLTSKFHVRTTTSVLVSQTSAVDISNSCELPYAIAFGILFGMSVLLHIMIFVRYPVIIKDAVNLFRRGNEAQTNPDPENHEEKSQMVKQPTRPPVSVTS